MNVPLSLIVTRTKDMLGSFKMLVTYNGKMSVVIPPSVKTFRRTGRGKRFKPVGKLADRYEEIMATDPQDYKDKSGNCPVSYYQRLFIDYEEGIKMFANTNPLKIMYFDIEVLTRGDRGFPHASTNPIMLIAYAFNDGPIETIQCYNGKSESPDKQILEVFMDIVEREDPDIISGYNSVQFDMPYIVYRCKMMEVDYAPLSRIYTIGKKLDEFGGEPGARTMAVDILEEMVDKEMQSKRKRNRYKKQEEEEESGRTSVYNRRRNTRFVFDMGGRLHYDIYNVDVVRDQLLTGLPNKTLKTMAKFYGTHEPVEIDRSIMHNLEEFAKQPGGWDKLVTYVKSDVECTRDVHKRYFDTTVAIADDLTIPLSHSVSRSNGTPATVLILKGIEKSRMIVVDSNAQRYKDLYERYYKYRGASVSINEDKKGKKLFDLKKFDYSSMYPNAMITWNLGPDTVLLIKTTQAVSKEHLMVECKSGALKEMDLYQTGGVPDDIWEEFAPEPVFDYDKVERTLRLSLPDQVMNTVFHLRIDMSKDSFVRQQLKDLTTRKGSLGRKLKKIPDTPENATTIREMKARRNAIKVQANSMYGILANQHGIGDLPIAAAVTSLCRYTIGELVKHVGKDDLVELDTDGIVCVGNHTLKEMQDASTQAVKNTFKTTPDDRIVMSPAPELIISKVEDHMFLEAEEFDRGYFHLQKNYCLLEKGTGNIIKHGATMKSSAMTGIEGKVRDKLIDLYMLDKSSVEEIKDYASRIENFELKDFFKRVVPSKNFAQYQSGDNTMVYRLMEQARSRGVTHRKGEAIEYIRVKRTCDPDADVLEGLDLTSGKAPVLVITGSIVHRTDDLMDVLDFDSYLENEVKSMFEVFSIKYKSLRKTKGVLRW